MIAKLDDISRFPNPRVASSSPVTISDKRLSILLPVLNFGAEETGVGRYTYEMARYFAQCGHHVRVICAPPYYPWWKVQPPYRCWCPHREVLDGMEILRLPLYVPRHPTGIRRLAHLASIALSNLLPTLLAHRTDVIWIAQPTLALAPAALLAARRMGTKIWMHVQDLEVSAADRLGILPQFIVDAIGSAESAIYGRCTALSTISGAMRTALEERCLHEIPLFPNWVDLDRIQPLRGPSPYRAELGIAEDVMVALYSGNMGKKQGLETVVEAARLLADRSDILFILAGQGAVREELVAAAAGLSNVRFLPLQPAERLSEFLALGDIQLVPQKAGIGNLVMPSKMTGILSAARPVVAACDPDDELRAIAQECGLAVNPGDTAGFAAAVLEMASSPEARRALGQHGRDFAERNLSHKVILPQMEEYLREVAALPPMIA